MRMYGRLAVSKVAAGVSGAAGQKGIDTWTQKLFGVKIEREDVWDGEERRAVQQNGEQDNHVENKGEDVKEEKEDRMNDPRR